MSTLQTAVLVIVILIGLASILCFATLWAEPREEDAPKKDLVAIDVERL